MELIGMLDSPYVRRVAIAFQLLGIDFKHRSVSVFGDYEAFRNINPVVKAPTLICSNGTVLTDSNLILDYGMSISDCKRQIMPNNLDLKQKALSRIGIALVACEKSIQIVYEQNLRPPEKLHKPWVNRVTEQLISAFTLLESALSEETMQITQITQLTEETIDLSQVTIAVSWKFVQEMLPTVIKAEDFPALSALSLNAESLPQFKAAPHGVLEYPVSG